MVRWRDFFSSEPEIDPAVEVFLKRVVFYCLQSNRYIEVDQPLQSLSTRNVGDALNILSYKYRIQIQRLINRYAVNRATMALHLEYLYIHLNFFYERCFPRFPRPMAYLLVLCLGMEVIYLIWSRFPQDEMREFTYATVYVLSRLFSSREFTSECSIDSIAYYGVHIKVGASGVLRFLRDNPQRPYENQPYVPLNYFDNMPRPEDRFSPEHPVSTPSWSDSGVSNTSPPPPTPPSPTPPPTPPPPTPPPPAESPHPGIEHHGCMPRIRRFFPQMRIIRRFPRIFLPFRLFGRFRRFCLELPRPFE